MKVFMKRLFVIVTLVVIVLTSILGVSADSNDRIRTYVNLAAGKQSLGADANELNLTKSDLQFLGVYISNFFVPFGTELGVSGVGGDTTTKNKEDIKVALQENLSFSDVVAESLTEELLGLSRSSTKELSIYVSKEYGKDLKKVDNMPADYYTFLSCMTGNFNNIISKYPTTVTGVLKELRSENDYKYGYFTYNGTPVLDFRIEGEDSKSELTVSQIAFLKALESVDMENGYGFSFFDLNSDEFDGENETYANLLSKLSNSDELLGMTISGMMMNVDCFGNIVVKGSNHQYVALPGAMNPYTWVSFSDGKEGSAGRNYNMINLQSLIADSKGTLFTSTGAFNIESVQEKFKSLESGSVTSLRVLRGSSNTSLDSYKAHILEVFKWFDKGEAGKVPDMIEDSFSNGSRKGTYNYPSFSAGGYTLPLRQFYTSSKYQKEEAPLHILHNMVYIDNLGAFHFDNSDSEVDFNRINVESYFSSSDIKSKVSDISSEYSNAYKDMTDSTISTVKGVSKELIVSLYMTYAIASLSEDTKLLNDLGYKLNTKGLPSIPNESLVLDAISEEDKEDLQIKTIRDWVYYLLNPSKDSGAYTTQLLKNKINSFLLGWHDDMVGTNGSGSINGTTKYRGFSGYVTTPELSDIPWVDGLLNFYYDSIPFLIGAMIFLMLCTFIGGILTIQKSIIALVVFVIALMLPPVAINSVVGVSNRFSSSLYGEKFTYWALVQHEGYSTKIDEAASGKSSSGDSSYSNYLKTLYSENANATGNSGGETLMLKWQAPKKMSSLMFSSKDLGVNSSSGSSKLISSMINKTYSGETYLNDDTSVYLYRSYIDIANFSRYIHRGLIGDNSIKSVNLNVSSQSKRYWNEGLKTSYDNYESTYVADRNLGYANANKDGSNSGLGRNILRVRLPLSSDIVADAYSKGGIIKDLKLGEYVGINQNAFNFDIPMFNVKSESFSRLDDVANGSFHWKSFDGGVYDEEDYSALAAYGLMSENPFYYFSWYLYETGLSENSGVKDGYKNLLLGAENGGFFYNTKGNGELKDFVDMRSLFTYIIPYLKQGNDLVKEWDDTYGLFVYEGVPTEEGHEDDADIKSSKELQQKYWHNLNVARLYNIYTPWVDVMYDCSYAKSEKISFLGKSYVISDPIDPSSYPEERPMIFSKSEMADYGLKEHQLTAVERRIIKAQEGMQERMFELLNYYTFSDVVLNTAAAMNCAFEFSEVFSENSLFGANRNIYPQTFELNDFSYDAFLRFILSNSTGESMIVNGEDSFYGLITEKSSMTTVIVLLVLDFLGVYVVPAFKVFFIVGLFILSLLIIFCSLVGVDSSMRFISRLTVSLLRPMLAFLGVSVGMAWVVSLFMGSGSNGVVGGSGVSISLGDPVVVMLVMVVINCVVVFLYFRLLWGVFKDLRKYRKLTMSFINGAVGGAGAVIGESIATGGFTSGRFRGSSGFGRGSYGGSAGYADRKGSYSSSVSEVVDGKTVTRSIYTNSKSRLRKFEKSSMSSSFDSKAKDSSSSKGRVSDVIRKGKNKIKFLGKKKNTKGE